MFIYWLQYPSQLPQGLVNCLQLMADGIVIQATTGAPTAKGYGRLSLNRNDGYFMVTSLSTGSVMQLIIPGLVFTSASHSSRLM